MELLIVVITVYVTAAGLKRSQAETTSHLVRHVYFYCLCVRTTGLLRKGSLSHCWSGRLYIPCESNVFFQ